MPPYELVCPMRCVWEALNAGAVWGKYARANSKDSDMTMCYAHLVSCYVDTFQIDEKILFSDSPALFGTFDYPGNANNKGFWLAHEPIQKRIRSKTVNNDLYEPILR